MNKPPYGNPEHPIAAEDFTVLIPAVCEYIFAGKALYLIHSILCGSHIVGISINLRQITACNGFLGFH
jgi:hypothetical protein